jgi:hypothetical protein
MGDRGVEGYDPRMIVSEQMQPLGANRVIFRELAPAAVRPQRGDAFELPQMGKWIDLLPSWLIRKQRVSNWLLALAFASTLGLSATASIAVISRPAATIPIVQTASYSGPAASIPASKVLPIVGDSPVNPANDSAHAQIATLQGRAAAMNSDLQRLQQDSTALRNDTQSQANDVSAARATLAGSQEGLNGESQQLSGRLDATQQDVQTRLGKLDDQVASADQLVNDVRKLLGLPATSNSSVGGGN